MPHSPRTPHTFQALLAALAISATAPALAEPMAIEMQRAPFSALFKGQPNVAIPTYHVNFVTSHQATAVASSTARARLGMVMVGPDETLMRRLTEDAYADFQAQLIAAGIPVVSAADTKAITAEMEAVPGNIDKSPPISGFTIGKSVKRGWVIFGPAAAPALVAYRNMSSTGGMSIGFGGLGTSKMYKPAGTLGAMLITPSLTIDFAAVSASTGGGLFNRASAAAEGKVGSMASIADDNYQVVQRARGDAVVVDLPVWEGLVRDAYRAYNAAIVAAVLSGRQ